MRAFFRTAVGQLVLALVLIVAISQYLNWRTSQAARSNQEDLEVLVHQLAATQETALAISARSDCRSGYNAIFQERINTRDNLFIGSLVRTFNGEADAFRLGALELATLTGQIDAFPKLDVAVDEGFVLDGIDYPPCPMVRRSRR